jgi:hypothetical protein
MTLQAALRGSERDGEAALETTEIYIQRFNGGQADDKVGRR